MSVYAWGSDRYGQLGLGRRTGLGQPGVSLHTPTPLDSVEAGVLKAVGGLGHSIVVTEFGDVYTCGRTAEGSLGTAAAPSGRYCASPVLVGALGDQAVVDVAAGSQTSVALTAAGQVYAWGLVHVDVTKDGRRLETQEDEGEAGEAPAKDSATEGLDGQAATTAAAGALTGMAAANARLAQDEVLARVVRKSTEAWLMAEDDFSHEMDLMGGGDYRARAEVKGESREAYEGMLRVRTVREPAFAPRLVRSLLGRRVRSVAAGYGHIMALTDEGQLFGAGYNDRGQLGLGHRINTARFQEVRTFSDRVVMQVVCGQQHTMARVQPASCFADGQYEVFVWGNGTLGQLGLGNLSTKLAPHRLAPLDDEGVVDLAAGANHSLALSSSGEVFFWGHTEYGQSGQTKLGADYEVEGHLKFYEPRPIAGLKDVCAIACGATFSLALLPSGHVVSWGWNESSVLGQGTSGRTALTPTRIPSLGPPATPPVVRISCGQTHAFAVTDASSARLPTLRPLLGTRTADVALLVPAAANDFLGELRSGLGRNRGSGSGSGDGGRDAGERARDAIFAHAFVLAARCPALGERIAAAQRQGLVHDRSSISDAAGPDDEDDAESAPTDAVALELDDADWSPATVRALLAYLYTDTLACPPHRYRNLRNLAGLLGLDHLVFLLDAALAQRVHANRYGPMAHALGMPASKAPPMPENEVPVVESRFVEDMSACIADRDGTSADVAFFLWEAEARAYLAAGAEREEPEVVAMLTSLVEAASAEDEAGEGRVVLFRAHKALLRRSSYFAALTSGRFLEYSDNAFADAFYVDVAGFLADGLLVGAIRRFLLFLYTGSRSFVPEDDPTGAMALAVVAGRFDAPSLQRLCEQRLTAYVTEPENARSILDFATTFSLPRLQLIASAALGPDLEGGTKDSIPEDEKVDETNQAVRGAAEAKS